MLHCYLKKKRGKIIGEGSSKLLKISEPWYNNNVVNVRNQDPYDQKDSDDKVH